LTFVWVFYYMHNLTDAHIAYIVVRYHIQKIKIVDIYNELIDPRLTGDTVNKYGVVPVTGLSKSYFYTRIHRIDEDAIESIKDKWMEDLMSEPLAIKKVRVQELSKLYKIEGEPEKKARILKLIKEEVGEQGWQKAVSESGTNVTVASGLTSAMIKTIATSIVNEKLEDYNDDDED